MSDSLPFAVRVAAGTVASGVDFLRRLPEDLPSLSVTAAGHAMRASMRVRQEITELASRGDELLAPFVTPPQEDPPWARFDEDDDDSEGDGDDGATGYDGAAEGDGAAGDEVPAETGSTTATGGTTVEDVMPGYDDLRLAQVRGRMLRLTVAELDVLIAHEETHQQRASMLTMLRNRITTLEHQDSHR